MELIDRLKEVLKEEFNICSDEELLEAVQSMPELDLGIFVTPLKGDNNAKSAQRYTASAQDVSGYEVSIEDNTQTITTEEPQETFKTEYTSTIMNEEINADDAYMLCKIAMAEAEGEDVEGKALVMLVVLNRTKAEGFPDTVSEVIYEKGQFTPVANGRFQKVEPNKECFEALQMIVSEKWDGSLGATYFESESSSTWHRDNLNYLYSHGGHDFYIDREE